MIAGRIGCQPTDLGKLPYLIMIVGGAKKKDCSVMAKKLRPPKPKDRISAPRFKMEKAAATTQSQGGKKAALTNVKALISADAAPEYFTEFFKQVRGENNDRGAAILTATNTDNSLKYALSRRLTTSLGGWFS